MKFGEVFPSAFLKAADLDGGDMVVTIKEVTVEEIGQGDQKDRKGVIHFDEIESGMVCNKTNALILQGMYGDETDDWIGKRITLFVDPNVFFAGKRMPAIRIRDKKASAAAPPAAGPNASAKPPTPLQFSEAVALAEQAGITAEALKAKLRARGINAWNAARDTAAVYEIINETFAAAPVGGDDETPF